MDSVQSIYHYARQHLRRTAVLDIQLQPKDVWTEQSVTGPKWATWPSDHPTTFWVKSFGQKLRVTSTKWTRHVCLVNTEVPNSQSNP